MQKAGSQRHFKTTVLKRKHRRAGRCKGQYLIVLTILLKDNNTTVSASCVQKLLCISKFFSNSASKLQSQMYKQYV